MARRVGRRMFLCGAGGLVVGVPTLSSLLSQPLSAQPSAAPKRFIVMQSYSGQINRSWYPTATPAGYRLRDDVYPGTEKADGTTHLHERLPADSRYGYAPLSDFASTGISEVLGPEFNPFLDKLTLLRGIDMVTGCGHNSGAFLGNYTASTSETARGLPAMPTIDQVMAYSDRFYPERVAQRSLHLGTGSPNTFSYSDYGIPGGEVESGQCMLDPRQVWDALFDGFTTEEDPMPTEDPRRSLVNGIYEDYSRVSRHRRLSYGDRQLLERHMSFLADIEADLGAYTRAACVPPDAPPSYDHSYPWSELHGLEAFRESCALLLDMAVAAIRCDLTRIVTFKVQEGIHAGSGSWEGSYHSSADVPSDWHHFAHDAFASASSLRNLTALNQWVATDLFVPLLERLDVEEADGRTYLDNSLVVWGNELGLAHYNITTPTLMAGSAGGALQTGRYIDYCKWDGDYANPIDHGVLIPGLPHNRLLVTMLQAMGLRPEDYERDGMPGYAHREIASTPWAWPDDAWDMSRVGEPLPGLLT